MLQIIILVLIIWLVGLVEGQCYSFEGVEMDPTYKPCNGSAPVSMCCHLGVVNNGGDECGSGSTYGLCGISGTQLWRESCTDKTWQSPLCLRLCVGANDTEITACPNGRYCCGKNAADCCDANKGKFIVNNQVSDTAAGDSLSSQTSQATTTSSTSISTEASKSMSATTSGIPSAVDQTSKVQTSVLISTVYQPLPSLTSTTSSSYTTQSLSTGARVGIGAGAGAFVVLMSLLALLLWKRKHPKGKLPELPATETKPTFFSPRRRLRHVDIVEADGTTPRAVEVHGNGRRIEPMEML
ncbi:uncharacterized protein EAF01_009350 [Botrytis porri]|uniref:Mid2 domain-containing protein n=1 Tax=Botrytis porri TaxID=87229 RepID=A0A4Z1KKD8_9HELO|nr:uncharacterized protein EAF01_009350 [Botrytis porri]KAF7896947.1 hypothetical protein EAF01_009350 [Botrytis porri]TGO86533.1 hypothetical protein BPOR_0295g00060 [Botrytis porri]